jgi:predicted DNA binding CopG/RHH family protein
MKKRIPVLTSDEAAEAFLSGDLSAYLTPGNFADLRFEYKPKAESINLRLSKELLTAVRSSARRQGVPYQRFIRMALERAVRPAKSSA